jgi:hypothetical protein
MIEILSGVELGDIVIVQEFVSAAWQDTPQAATTLFPTTTTTTWPGNRQR